MNRMIFFRVVVPAVLCVLLLTSLVSQTEFASGRDKSLRKLYARPVVQWPKPNIDSHVSYQEFSALPIDSSGYSAKAQLGQLLFFDPRLSGSNQISCSSCHDPERNWGDARRVSVGHNHLEGKRNSISLLNVSAQKSFFWDGRSQGLADQAISPLATPHEMNTTVPMLASKISKINGYQIYFEQAYGDARITLDRILEAIASFEETIKSEPSRFDKFMKGDYQALTDQELRGLDLFRGKARCMNCHNGTYFKDDQFHNTGFGANDVNDQGRYETTRIPTDKKKFRTASLRDVTLTGPWMHNGLFDNLDDIIRKYNHEGLPHAGDSVNHSIDPILRPLKLTEAEIQDVAAFLNAITARPRKMQRPVLPD